MACCLCEKDKTIYHKIENSGRVVCFDCINNVHMVQELRRKLTEYEIANKLLERLYRNIIDDIIEKLSAKECC